MTQSSAVDDRTEISKALFTYLLRLGDDSLILSHRLSELVSWQPDLEEDIAVANLALDHLGQCRNLYTYAGAVEGAGRDEDQLAFLRDEREFFNLVLCEQPNGDFGQTMARQLLFDAFRLPLMEGLAGSSDTTLSGIAGKAAKEARYHLRHSTTWVVRLGDGTEESNRRMQAGLDFMWRYTDEMFQGDDVEQLLVEGGIAVDPAALRPGWESTIASVLEQAHLTEPTDPRQRGGGRTGHHTEALGHVLPEMQYLQRAYPGLEW